MNEVIAAAIGGFSCGLLWGMVAGKWQYRRLLVLLARAGSAEKLTDGKFYHIVPEEKRMKTITYNPETHKLVPLEPTRDMIAAAAKDEASKEHPTYASMYAEMIAAAPAASGSAEEAPQQEHDLKDVRCECCGYLTHQREHMGCIRAAKQQPATHGEPVLFIHPDTFAMNNAHVGAWKPGHELEGYIPLYTSPQPTPTHIKAMQQAIEACEQRLPLVGQAAIIDELNALRAALKGTNHEHTTNQPSN